MSDLRERVAAYRAEHPKATQDTIAAALGVSRRQVRNALGLTRDTATTRPAEVPRGEQAPLEREVRLADTSALVIADMHVPYHNADLLNRALDLVTRRHPQVKQVVIAGDLFDFAGISRHPHDQREAAISEELATAGKVLRALLAPFERAYILPGNHDERLAKKLEAHVPMRFLIDGCLGTQRPACEIVTTEYDYVYLDHSDPARQWVIGHPSHYSGQGGRTPASIADLEGRNVMTGHNHVIGLQQSPSGKWLGVDIGHMTDPRQHLYVRRRLTKFARWSAGFAVILDGYAHPYYERFTNWSA